MHAHLPAQEHTCTHGHAHTRHDRTHLHAHMHTHTHAHECVHEHVHGTRGCTHTYRHICIRSHVHRHTRTLGWYLVGHWFFSSHPSPPPSAIVSIQPFPLPPITSATNHLTLPFSDTSHTRTQPPTHPSIQHLLAQWRERPCRRRSGIPD
jgi:hypothetical protein